VGKLVVQQVGARRIVAVQQRTLDRRSIRRADLGMLARVDPQLLCPVKHRRAQAQADLLGSRGPDWYGQGQRNQHGTGQLLRIVWLDWCEQPSPGRGLQSLAQLGHFTGLERVVGLDDLQLAFIYRFFQDDTLGEQFLCDAVHVIACREV